jgi:hypothetical protein
VRPALGRSDRPGQHGGGNADAILSGISSWISSVQSQQEAALSHSECCNFILFFAVVLALFWPSYLYISKVVGSLALAVLVTKFCCQPAIVCYIPSQEFTSEFSTTAMRKIPVTFPSLYIAYTGNLLCTAISEIFGNCVTTTDRLL